MKRILAFFLSVIIAVPIGCAVPQPLKADAGIKMGSLTITSGSAAPESSVTAAAGSLYLRSNGTIYWKATGSGNTGWTAVGTGGGSSAWGAITGTITDQTDLATSFAAKQSRGLIRVSHASGAADTVYLPSANTNAARGTILLTAAAANTTAGDTIFLGPGSYDVTSTRVLLAAGVNLIGSPSTILSSADLFVAGPIVTPGSNSSITNLTVTGSTPGGTGYQSCIGMVGTNGDSAASNVTVTNCTLTGSDTDVIYLEQSTACAGWVFRDCRLASKWDACTIASSDGIATAAHVVDLYNCTIATTGPSTSGSQQSRCVAAFDGGTINVHGGTLTATNGGTSINCGAYADRTGAVNVDNVTIATSNSGTPSVNHDVVKTATGVITVTGGRGSNDDGSFTTQAASGFITFLGDDYARITNLETEVNASLDGKQPLDADLTGLAGLSYTQNSFPARTASGAGAPDTKITIGSDFSLSGNTLSLTTVPQPLDADLTYLAGFTPTANVKTILNAADYAAIKTALGLTIGTNVQAFDSDLTTWAGVTPGTGIAAALAINAGSAGAPVLFNGAGGTPSSLTVTNATGTASININGTVGATTPTTGAFTTATASSGITAYNATAVPAGGTTGSGFKFSSTSNLGVFFGSGAPSLSAAQGSLYVRTDGVPYYNNNGTTGWTSLAGGSGSVTSIDVSGGTTGLTASGGPVTGSGTITLAGTLAVANGGTGSTTASAARTALGLIIGTNVQAFNANLSTFAGIAPSANAQSLLGAADYSAMRTQLSLRPGTDIVAFGGAVGTGATLDAPIFTNIPAFGSGAYTVAASAMGALVIDVSKRFNTKGISADSTVTFSGTPASTTTLFGAVIKNTDTASHTLTLPSCFSMDRQITAAHVITIPASGRADLQFRYDGTDYTVWGDVVSIADLTTATIDPANDYLQFWDATDSLHKKATPNAVKTALSLVIGTNVQAWDADLDYLAGFTPSANVKTILNAADYAAVKTALGLTIGTNVQAFDADLSTYAGITPSANVQSLLGAADYAAMKTQLGLTIGTNVQAFDSDLTTWAGVTPGTGVATAAAAAINGAGGFTTTDGTKSLTNTTLDAAATGNVLKLKNYIYLTHPHLADGTNATIGTTATAIGYGHATFSNSVDKATNYVEYYLQVPEDIDTSVALRARLKIALGNTDTGKQGFRISSVSVADSAVPTASTLANEISINFGGDASGASGDVETSAWTTLTSWAGALTAGQTWRIRLARDGDDGTDDTSTVNCTELGLVLEYGVTQ